MGPSVIRGRGSRLTWLVLLLVTAGCDILGPDAQVDGLEEARERWAATAPDPYTFAVERLCFCGPDARGPVRMIVSGGTITSQIYVEGAAEVVGQATEWFPDVEGLFDVIQDAIDRDAHTIQVTYDQVTGVPVDLWIDYEEFTADEELGFRVVEGVRAAS